MKGETIYELQKIIHKTAKEKGWWDEPVRTFEGLIALCHSELSEALEEYRSTTKCSCCVHHKGDKPVGVVVELADCIIRILDMAEYYNMDLQDAVENKIEYNKTRSYRHGGKKF